MFQRASVVTAVLAITAAIAVSGVPRSRAVQLGKRVAILVAEDEYDAARTLPAFADRELRGRGFQVTYLLDDGGEGLTNVDALDDADVLVVFARRRTFDDATLAAIREYALSDRPVVGIRTASHAFQDWLEFDERVLGGNYRGHHGNEGTEAPRTLVRVRRDAEGHPVLAGVRDVEVAVESWLYKVAPLADTATPLMTGRVEEAPPEPVAWVNELGRKRVFYTSLGHPADFELEAFRRLLVNGILWTLELDPPRWPALSPEEALAAFDVADGFEVTLAASEPTIVQPVEVKFDERGRMWVVQYVQYMYPAGLEPIAKDEWDRTTYGRVPEPPPRGPRGADRVTICEDRDGDGVFESTHDFVDGLNLATSVAIGHGGVWVAQTPYLLFYADADRDDRPDGEPRVVLAGFGMEDAHAVVNSLTWGPDGWLYGAQGSTVTARVRGHVFQQAAWRYHPDTDRFEVFAEGGGNTFGLEFDRHGELLTGTNWAGYTMVHYVQGGYYVKNFGKHGPLSNPHAYGHFPHAPHEGEAVGHVAHVGLSYQGGAFPDELAGAWIVPHLLGNRVCVHDVLRHGSSFRTRHRSHLLTSADTWFRPVDLVTGPDGAVYVADWYDGRATHLIPVDDWHKTSGRVWRIAPPDAPPPDPFDLAALSSHELVDLLLHENDWYARTARRILDERNDPTVHARLLTLIDNPRDGRLALQALWALYVSDGFYSADLDRLLVHPNEDVRAWTVRFIGDHGRPSSSRARELTRVAETDTSAVVRRQLAATARRLRAKYAVPILHPLLQREEDADDPHVPLLCWWALEKVLFAEEPIADIPSIRQLLDTPLGKRHLVPRFVRRYSAEGTDECLTVVARLLFEAEDGADLARRLAALDEGLRGRRAVDPPEALSAALRHRVEGEPDGTGVLRLRLRCRLGDEDAESEAFQYVLSGAPPASRVEVIRTLAEVGARTAAFALILLLAEDQPKEVRLAALDGLQHFAAPELGGRVLDHWEDLALDDDLRDRAIELLSRRRVWALDLARAVADGTIAPADVPPEVVSRLRRHGDDGLDSAAARLWGAGRRSDAEKGDEMRRVRNALGSRPGDRETGKRLFADHCGRCHPPIGEQGVDLAPDLTGVERSNLDSLLVSTLDPSVAIRDGWEEWILVTNDGLLLTGTLVEETPLLVSLRDSAGIETSIARDEIESLTSSPVSRMPEGLLESLTDRELADLFAYLQHDGE